MMKKVPLIVGNWKMNRTRAEARLLAQAMIQDLAAEDSAEVVICPPFTALSVVGEVISGTNVMLGAQNMHHEKSGAFTGEVSPLFLKELGCAYVLLGHSERRQHFGETDALIARKLKSALETGLAPIVCLGETLAERQAGRTFPRLEEQFLNSIRPVVNAFDSITIAYEPVWAIGTGRNARPEQAAEVHHFLRDLADREYGELWTRNLRIIYGGSVTAANIDELMARPLIDGVLVGGASLKSDFVRIVKFQTPA
jgi:triosephosphate isomerase